MIEWLKCNPSDRDLQAKIHYAIAAPESFREKQAAEVYARAKQHVADCEEWLRQAQSALVVAATACRAEALHSVAGYGDEA
jgi:uncharacterized protein YeaO (DUF488 family)